MSKERDFFQALHKRTQRDYAGRMVPEKVHCCEVAKRYGEDYWDGDRKYGYGGYRYDGRWKPVAERLIEAYGLGNKSTLLDVGCGKGFLLHEIKLLLPGCNIRGCDISEYAIKNAKEEIREHLFIHNAKDPFPFEAGSFDLVISMTTLHNLYIYELFPALREIERVGKEKYVLVESYRDEQEKFNLQCWALTAEAYFSTDEWCWIFKETGYKGDYEFIVFE